MLRPLTVGNFHMDFECYTSSFEHLRSTFTYHALDLAERRQLGCGCIFPSHKQGFDVLCQTWVQADEFDRGFDPQFYEWFRDWVHRVWPFDQSSIGWPGRAISWDERNDILDKPGLVTANNITSSWSDQ